MLRRLAGTNLDKGEVLALTMLGNGEQAKVVAVDRHRPPRA
jgi:8-oxo-dGTP diphosphatase